MTQGHSRLREIRTCDREEVRGQTWRNLGLMHLESAVKKVFSAQATVQIFFL